VVPRHAHWGELGLRSVSSRLLERPEPFAPVQQHQFEHGGDAGVNLILCLPGKRPERQLLPVSAHCDGPLGGSPGADDNASGVAALLELASRLAASPPHRPLWLLAFAQQGWGMVGGSALAPQLRQGRRQSLHRMLSLEMLDSTSETQNYPLEAMRNVPGNCGNDIALIANLFHPVLCVPPARIWTSRR